MSSFYRYKQQPLTWEEYTTPKGELAAAVEARVLRLKPISLWVYGAHWLINGRAYPVKEMLGASEVVPKILHRLEEDFAFSNEQGWETQIRIADHIEEQFGLSVLLCMRAPDNEGAGWVMLEQVVLRRGLAKFVIWRYADDTEEDDSVAQNEDAMGQS